MKQVLQDMRSGKTQVVKVPIPQLRPGTALVKTAASLVSAGTERKLVDFASKNLIGKARSRPDLVRQVVDKAKRDGWLPTVQTALNRLDQQMALGYSSSGTIVACGEGLIGFKPGDRVACAGGGHALHAEYAIIPQNLMAHLSDEVDFEAGAFANMGAIALNGFRLAHLQVGDYVAVIGLGLLGLITVKVALAAGCTVFGTDLNPERIKIAKGIGITAVHRSKSEESGLAFTHGRGFDAVLICADTPSDDTVVLAGQMVRDRGYVISLGVVGLNLPRKPYYEKEIHFQVSRSSGPGRYDYQYEEESQDYPIGYVRWTEGRNMEAFIDLISKGKISIKELISHRFPIEEAPAAYELITGKSEQTSLGILMTYPTTRTEKTSTKIAVTKGTQNYTVKGQPGLGVLGAGNYANAVFLPVIASLGGVNLHTIISSSGSSAQQAAKKFGFQFASSAESDVMNNKSIHLITILTRHQNHAYLVLECLKNNKHVYCEKPLGIRMDEIEKVEKALARKEHPILTVGFNRRFSTLGQVLKKFYEERSEPLYAHYRVNAGYLPVNHWLHDPQIGGGRIIGEGCHFIDFITFLVGQPPISVSAKALPDQGKYQQDNVLITLEFPDGSIGSIDYLANGDKSFSKEYLEVFCGGKIGILDDFHMLTTIENGHREKMQSRLHQDKGHRNAWSAFLTSIRDATKPPIPYAEILGVSRASIQAVQSLNSGIKILIG